MINLFTIGFTNKSAEKFFELLRTNHIRHIIDTRINNVSQLAGFSKGKDLAYFASQICNASYSHRVELAPTKDLLRLYRAKEIDWAEYEIRYLDLLRNRAIQNFLRSDDLDRACLLCSEDRPDFCHRRLLADYLVAFFPDLKIVHI